MPPHGNRVPTWGRSYHPSRAVIDPSGAHARLSPVTSSLSYWQVRLAHLVTRKSALVSIWWLMIGRPSAPIASDEYLPTRLSMSTVVEEAAVHATVLQCVTRRSKLVKDSPSLSDQAKGMMESLSPQRTRCN